MLFLAVNYHYIHEENKYPFPGIHSTPLERFINQLEQLGKYFQFISQDDLLNAIEGKKKLPEKCCLITFDDGLKSQYENALPILKQKGIPAVFFVNALPYKEKKACLVHKIHYLRANLPPEEFLNEIESLGLTFRKSLKDFSVDNNKAKEQYRYDEPKVAILKFILNNVLPENKKEKIINEIFKKLVDNEADFCEMFYMSEKQISDLYNLSFLGIHSYSHKPLSRLSKSQLVDDISRCLATIYEIVGNRKINGISYPYGGPEAINARVANLCQSLGLKYGFTMERAFNRTLEEPLLFARMDTNDVLGGKFSTFTFENNKIKILGKMTLSRQIYFYEKV